MDRVILYGGSNIERFLSRFQNAETHVECCVSAYSERKEVCGLPVYRPEILKTPAYDRFPVVVTLEYRYKEISEFLIREYQIRPERILQDRAWFPELLTDANVIVRDPLKYEVHLTEHCNLNCRGCSHFSPLAKEEYLDVDEYARDCARLGELFHGRAEMIHLLGGEPLLHPHVTEFFEITRKNFPIAPIKLVTNGILLPKMSSDFWRSCRENNIEITPTYYPINIDYDGAEQKALKEGVSFQRFGAAVSEEKTLSVNPLDLSGRQKLSDSFYQCSWLIWRCNQLQHGRLYICGIPPYIRHFASYFDIRLPDFTSSGIDIYRASGAEEISRFLLQPIDACQYCDFAHRTYGLAWGRSERKINEWLAK